MSDNNNLQIAVTLVDWRCVIAGTICGDGSLYTAITSCCQPECPIYDDACNPSRCPYDDETARKVIMGEYQGKVKEILRIAAGILGIECLEDE